MCVDDAGLNRPTPLASRQPYRKATRCPYRKGYCWNEHNQAHRAPQHEANQALLQVEVRQCFHGHKSRDNTRMTSHANLSNPLSWASVSGLSKIHPWIQCPARSGWTRTTGIESRRGGVPDVTTSSMYNSVPGSIRRASWTPTPPADTSCTTSGQISSNSPT